MAEAVRPVVTDHGINIRIIKLTKTTPGRPTELTEPPYRMNETTTTTASPNYFQTWYFTH